MPRATRKPVAVAAELRADSPVCSSLISNVMPAAAAVACAEACCSLVMRSVDSMSHPAAMLTQPCRVTLARVMSDVGADV